MPELVPPKSDSAGIFVMRRSNPSRNNSQSFNNSQTYYEGDIDKFQNGSIMSIKLKDFMTFEKITIQPGAGLNLIIGPNGSGKSTIVCAIGLGLASSTSILARTSKLSGFIRHGCPMASIKILLKSDIPIWINRRIKSDNSSKWRIKNINGRWKDSSAAEVAQRVSALHIQLDNLCMFLPQERVKEFATLKPPQLLTATEQAINPEVYDTHQALLKDFQKHFDLTQKISDLTQNLNRYQTLMDQMRVDVERLNAANECKKQIEKFEKAIPWAEHRAAKIEYATCRTELQDALRHYDQAAANIRPLSERKEAKAQECRRNNDELGRESNQCQNFKNELLQISNSRFEFDRNASQQKQQLENLKKNLASKQDDVDKMNHAIEIAEDKVKGVDSDFQRLREEKANLIHRLNDVKRQSSEASGLIDPIKRERARKQNELKDIDVELKRFDNQKKRLLDHIGTNLRRNDVVELYNYIESRRNTFNANVYGPICAELNFAEIKHANVLHMIVENHFLFAFLTEDEHDRDSLEEFCQRNKLRRITLLRASDNFKLSQQQKMSQQLPPPNLTKYGFAKYVIDTFEAPVTVKNMLNQMAQLDRVPIGGGPQARSSVHKLSEDTFLQYNITRYIVDSVVYYVKRSKYSSNISTLSIPVRQSNIWREASAGAETIRILRERKDNIEAEISRLNQEERDKRAEASRFTSEIESLSQEIQDIAKKIKDVEGLNEKIRQLKIKRDQLVREKEDLPRKIAQIEAKLNNSLQSHSDSVLKQYQKLKQFNVHMIKYDLLLTQRDNLQAELEDINMELQRERQKYSELERQIKILKDKRDALKQKEKELKDIAKVKCPKTPENIAMLSQLPSDIEMLRDELARHQSRLNAIQFIDPTLQQRFADTERKLNETQEQLNNISREANDLFADCNARFAEWKQKMSLDVKKMSDSFSKLMATCNYRGEVKLGCEDPAKIETYKLNLLVAFNRDGAMNILSSTRQSGGEKSVTTLMFLLALQDCTKFPFRVVDEINQGMDETNDRNAFNQIMKYTMSHNQESQYFLVTPKLLPNLEELAGITVMVVMNGPYIDEHLTNPITFMNGDDNQQSQQLYQE